MKPINKHVNCKVHFINKYRMCDSCSYQWFIQEKLNEIKDVPLEQQFHDKLNKNICLHCDGSGHIDNKKPPSLGNTCPHCMGTGKRFQHLLKDGILEF